MDADFGVKSIVREAWDILKREKKFLLLFGLVLVMGNMALNGIGELFTDQGWSGASSLWGVVTFVLKMYLGLITIIVSLKAVRGESLTVQEILVKDWKMVWPYVLISILYSLVVIVGTILLIVPGIIVGLMYFLSTYLVVDQGLGVIESMKESKRLTRGKRGKLFLMGLATLGINILGIICLGVGVVVTAPLTVVMGGLIYQRLVQQPIKPKVQQPAETKLPVQESRKVDSDMSQYQI